MRRFRCKQEIIESLKTKYDEITSKEFNNNYLEILKKFDQIAENKLRGVLDPYYDSSRSRDQAWKTCKGALYEYAVFKYINHIIKSDKSLNEFSALMGEDMFRLKDQFVIRNWSDIFPDVDILIVEGDQVRVIVSCKTSLRERLTETAFWKRELERNESTRNIKLVFVTTDKDNELQQDVNRYILLHVLDCTFITDPQKYISLIKYYRQKYGSRQDFNKLMLKVKSVEDFKDFLANLRLKI